MASRLDDPCPCESGLPFSLCHGRTGQHDSDVDRFMVAAFLANVPDFVHFKDRDGRFIAVSRSKLKRNGLSDPKEIIGKTDFDFFSEKAAQKSKADEDEVIRTGVPIVNKLEHVNWADGRETWSLVSKLPLRAEADRIIGTFGITKDITEMKQMENALEKAHRELVDASHSAGMAEVATSVLHNVGNVLNSLNVSASVVAAGLRQLKVDSIARTIALIEENRATLGAFLTEDPRGKLIPQLWATIAKHLSEERDRLSQEMKGMQANIDHIKDIVSMQQAYATMVGVIEPLDPAMLMEDSVRLNTAALLRHEVEIVREFQPTPPVLAERAKVLQILVNLIRNAKYACDDCPPSAGKKTITLRIVSATEKSVRLEVEDNGVGITPENLTRVFQLGFTTRKTGHGFGLHSSANAAKEMKGTLAVASSGPNRGARFTLELPVAP